MKTTRIGRWHWHSFAAMGVIAALVGMGNAFSAETEQAAKDLALPTVVGEWDLAKDFAKMESQWDSIYAILESNAYFALKEEGVSLWSCGQQAGHLALTLDATADSINDLLAHPEKNADGEVSAIGKQLLSGGLIPRGVGKAPDNIRPENTSREALLATLKSAQQKWTELAGKGDALEACTGRAPHQTGMFSSTDWVRMMAVHNAHHLKIVRDIVAASGDAGKGFGEELGDAE